jgi:hypothetical protein
VVLAIVVEDQVGLSGGATANVYVSGYERKLASKTIKPSKQPFLSLYYVTWTEHDVVLGLSIVVTLVNVAGVQLDVATTAIDVLLVLDTVLHDEVLALVRELGELGADLIESSVYYDKEKKKKKERRLSNNECPES